MQEWRKRVSGRSLKDSGAGVSSYTTELAPGVTDMDASSAALISAAPVLAPTAPAPTPYTQPDSAEGESFDAALDSASAEAFSSPSTRSQSRMRLQLRLSRLQGAGPMGPPPVTLSRGPPQSGCEAGER